MHPDERDGHNDSSESGDEDGRFGKPVRWILTDRVIGRHEILPFGGTDAAHQFERSGHSWTQREKLAPADGQGADYFATSVALSPETALVGANDSNEEKLGGAYAFDR